MNHYGDLVPANMPGTFPADPSLHPGPDLGTRDPSMHPGLDPGIVYPQPAPLGAAGVPGAGLLPGGRPAGGEPRWCQPGTGGITRVFPW